MIIAELSNAYPMVESLVNIVVLVCLTGLTLVIKRLWTVQDTQAKRHEALERDFNALRVELPTVYVRRHDIEAMESRVIAELSKLETNIDRNFSNIYKELKSKADK